MRLKEFRERNVRVSPNNEFMLSFKNVWAEISLWMIFWWYSAFLFAEKLRQTTTKVAHALFFVSFNFTLKLAFFIISSICGSTKTPFTLASLIWGILFSGVESLHHDYSLLSQICSIDLTLYGVGVEHFCHFALKVFRHIFDSRGQTHFSWPVFTYILFIS